MTYYPPVGERDESCLFLNIFTAAGAPDCSVACDEPRPVMVYVHGGSFVNGGANEDRLNGVFTVDKEPGLVVVVIQYRLGVLGFAGGDALGGVASGNYGVQDQRAALRWVRRSIGAFGGDKSRVLLAGQSAGAGSVSVQLVSTRSAGLFSRALMLSGAFGHWITQRRDEAGARLVQLAKAVGCARDDDGSDGGDDEGARAASAPRTRVDAACLRRRGAMELVNASLSIPYGPTTQTEELPDEPWALARRGALGPHVPLMLGSTAEDGTSPAAAGGKAASGVALRAWLARYFGPAGGLNYSRAQLEGLNSLYASAAALNRTWRVPDARGSRAYWASIRLLADAEMACPARRVARWRQAAAAPDAADAASASAPPGPPRPAAPARAFWYLWAHAPLYGRAAGLRCAYHASELPYLFHVLRARDRQYQLNSDAERALSAELLAYVAAFAADGAPAARGAAVAWDAFDAGGAQSRLLLRAPGAEGGSRLESRTTNASDYEEQARTCALWDAIGDAAAPII